MDWQIYRYQGRSIDFAELLLGLSERGMKNIKKADSRIVLHIISFLKSGYSHVTVESYDTDVLIIVMSLMSYFDSLRTGCADLNILVKFGDRLFDIKAC